MGDVHVDVAQWKRAILTYQKATKKEIPVILNRAGRNVAFKAAQFTPKAKPADIESDLKRDPHLVYALTSMSLKKRGIGKLPAPQFAEAAAKFIANRKRSAGFIRSGWATAIEKLGGHYRGMKTKKVHGWATKASLFRFVTEIANNVPGAKKIGEKALLKAIDDVSRDMLRWAQDRLKKIADKHSS